MLLITVLGKNERRQIRTIIRHQAEITKALIVMPKKDAENLDQPLRSLIGFLNKMSVTFEMLKVSDDLETGVKEIKDALLGLGYNRDILLNLSDGNRLLCLQTILALNSLGIDAVVEIDEEGSGLYNFDLKKLSEVYLR